MLMQEFFDGIWNLLGGEQGIVTKILLMYIIFILKSHTNRIGEIEDKQESMVIGFKAVPTINGTFTRIYNESLDELRRTRDRKSKIK